jgi:hypothetical protein
MPDECPSMRSIARWVLPVLVGPSTAVTGLGRRGPAGLDPESFAEKGIFIKTRPYSVFRSDGSENASSLLNERIFFMRTGVHFA